MSVLGSNYPLDPSKFECRLEGDHARLFVHTGVGKHCIKIFGFAHSEYNNQLNVKINLIFYSALQRTQFMSKLVELNGVEFFGKIDLPEANDYHISLSTESHTKFLSIIDIIKTNNLFISSELAKLEAGLNNVQQDYVKLPHWRPLPSKEGSF